MNKINNKAFTLIELIVVIAILGVLVLLAAPKFLGYTEDAKVVQIKNDVKVVENSLEIELIEDPDFIANKGWESISLETMNSYVEEGSLFDTKGSVDGELVGEFYVIEDELTKTNLNGQFIASEGGKVYYYEDGLNVDGNGEANKGPEYTEYVLTDDDFEWVKSASVRTYYNKDGDRGYFKYVGTGQETIEIPHVIQGVEMTSYYFMFYGTGEDVEKVISTNENVTDMSYMFSYSQAASLDLSSFDTSSVTDMSWMFYYSSATELDLSSFDTSNVTNMSDMFYRSHATTLDLSSFDTSKVTHMSSMFRDSLATTCYAKTQADANKFNNSSNKPAGLKFTVKPGDVYMATDEDFSGTTNGKFRYTGTGQSEIEIPHVIKGVPVTSYSQMFANAGKDITKVVSTNPNVTNMSSMFSQSQATTLDLSSFDTSNVNDMSHMFSESQAITLDLSSFDTSNVTRMNQMFRESQAITLDLSSFDTSKVTNMSYMFQSSQATTLDLSSFNTSKVTYMTYIFRGSQATKGYARTTTDANKFNSSSYKPSKLNFVVN